MPRFSANLSMLFTEVPFLERFDLAAAHGFAAVEFWFPYEWPATEVSSRLREAGLVCVGINSPAGDTGAGDWGLAADPSRASAFRDSVKLAFDYAAELDCPAVHVMAGVTTSSFPDPLAQGGYLENIAFAAEHAARLGKLVLIEPLNPFDRPGYILWRQRQARDVIAAVGAPSVRVMYDLYHAQMTEGRLIDNLRAHGDLVGHVQVADVPGRHEPGTGEIHWPGIFNAIEQSDYTGWVGCEYKPTASTPSGLGWINRFR